MRSKHLHQPVGVQLKNIFLGQKGLIRKSSSQSVPLARVRLGWSHADTSLAVLGRDDCQPRRVFLEIQAVLLKCRVINGATMTFLFNLKQAVAYLYTINIFPSACPNKAELIGSCPYNRAWTPKWAS